MNQQSMPFERGGTSDIPPPERPTLASDDELAAERLMIQLLAHPAVLEAKRSLRDELAQDPSAATKDGQAWLDRAVDLYAASMAMREIGGDPSRPMVLRDLEPAAHTWFGVAAPARGTFGESMDNVYRFLSLDGRYRYELKGKVPPDGPIHYSLDARAAPAREPPGHPAPAGRTDSGIQLGLVTEHDVELDEAGGFIVTLDTDPAQGRRNHVQLIEGPATVLLRNVFSDWRQRPTEFTVRRTDAEPTPTAMTSEEIAQNLAGDLRAWARYWFDLQHTFLGNPPPHALPRPAPRDGGWGRLTACRLELRSDEAFVATLDPANARYFSAQILGPWGLPADPLEDLNSRNLSQSERDPDGLLTYVVSVVDPGVPNWLDSSRIGNGYFILRWSGFGQTIDESLLVRRVQAVKLSELDSALPAGLRRVGAGEREADWRRRIAEHAIRNTY